MLYSDGNVEGFKAASFIILTKKVLGVVAFDRTPCILSCRRKDTEIYNAAVSRNPEEHAEGGIPKEPWPMADPR